MINGIVRDAYTSFYFPSVFAKTCDNWSSTWHGKLNLRKVSIFFSPIISVQLFLVFQTGSFESTYRLTVICNMGSHVYISLTPPNSAQSTCRKDFQHITRCVYIFFCCAQIRDKKIFKAERIIVADSSKGMLVGKALVR